MLGVDHGDRRQAGHTRRPPAPFPGHQEVMPQGLGMQRDDQGLDDPLGSGRPGLAVSRPIAGVEALLESDDFREQRQVGQRHRTDSTLREAE